MKKVAMLLACLALTTVSCDKHAMDWDFEKSSPHGCTPDVGKFNVYKENGSGRLAISVTGDRYQLGLNGAYQNFYLDSTNDLIVKVHEFAKKTDPNFCDHTGHSINSVASWSGLEGLVQMRISSDSVAVNQDGTVQYVLDVKVQDLKFYKDGESGIIETLDEDEFLNVRMGAIEEEE